MSSIVLDEFDPTFGPVPCRSAVAQRRLSLIAKRLLLLITMLFATVNGSAFADEPNDAAVIQGRWKLADLQTPDALDKRATLAFTLCITRDHIRYLYANGIESKEHRFELIPDTNPKRINFPTAIADEKQERLGIYSVDGDELRICFDTVLPPSESRRPKDFTAPKGSGKILMRFQRVNK